MLYMKNITPKDANLGSETLSVLLLRLCVSVGLILLYYISAPYLILTDQVRSFLDIMILLIFLRTLKQQRKNFLLEV